MPRRPRTPHPEPTAAREALERRWFRRVQETPQLAPLVTARQNVDEPYHRWLAYKQAFAPKLVRLFLAQAEGLHPEKPILDPFAGSGTVPIECALQNRAAIGIEPLPALCFLARAAAAVEDDPGQATRVTRGDARRDPQAARTWRDLAGELTDPTQRAALILAVARQHDSDGRPLRDPPAIDALLADVLELMSADRQTPIARVDMREGDARELAGIEPESIGGILTSPPYLSRHDYTSLTRPLQQVYATWYGEMSLRQARRVQVRAHPRAHQADWSREPHPAAAEACEALASKHQSKLSGVVRSYFEDMAAALEAASRVLCRSAPLWMVVGGARLAQVYVPSELVIAELAEQAGFEVRQIREARRLTSARHLGELPDVAARESLLILRRR